ncbi:1,6-anhydro-N-acetylmuramyl-L-alanine amidase AmpD [Rodentibacter pneumotropicus]|uniref:1,6-anhydro-N-acetylmuramyl-L-alanine amidase AmpD n=1 Tax=Rodentibacter pneumotropicus TaxID=758 RepID=A0A3S4TX65_9PAST|nr:1,6-anhydro-N-acetylmuramyl-L-alanine amidase AmpD [Rodentibacter pneumotropicus]
MSAYPDITLNRIVGHSDISPGRKIDPGQYFDWERYLNGINSLYKNRQ